MQPPSYGIFYGDKKWFKDNDFTWFPEQFFLQQSLLHHRDGQTTTLKRKISERVDKTPYKPQLLGQASAVFEAETVMMAWPDNVKRRPTIVKIWLGYAADGFDLSI